MKAAGSTSTTARVPDHAPATIPAATPTAILTSIRNELGELARLLATPAVPGVHLSSVECDRLAELLGLSTAVTGASLITAIDRLASVRIGDIRIPFTPGQLAELQHRAAKRGRTVDAEMRAVVARIENELFYQGG